MLEQQLHLFVPLFVAWLAKPNYVQLFVVILMMCQRFFAAAPFARKPNESACTNSSGHSVVSCQTSFVLMKPRLTYGIRCFRSFWNLRSLAVVCPIVFNARQPGRTCIFFRALFALAEMPVVHLRMNIEIFECFDPVTLETLF